MTLDLDGLIPATVLPMHADGSIDEPALRAYIRWVVDQGPVALAINVDIHGEIRCRGTLLSTKSRSSQRDQPQPHQR